MRSRFRWGVALALVTTLLAAACTSSHGSSGHSSASGSSSSTSGATHQPNFVFVLTDDLSTNLVQYMPHVQAMQKAGVSFSNYFVVDSLCCPSRSAIFTGEYPHDDGVFTNGGDDGGYQTFKDRGNEQHTFAVALQKAGYQTGFMGKYLNGYKPQDGVPPGWNEWDGTAQGYQEFDYTLNENGKAVHYGADPQDYLTDVVSGKAASFIDKQAAADKPFMLEVATFAPHAPSTPAPRDANSFPDLKAPHGPAYGKTPADAPSWLKAIPPLTSKDESSIDIKFRKRVQSVQAVDDMIARLQQELQTKGLADDTYFVFSSDNGFHMGDYMLRPGKQTAFDTDIRLPFVVDGPGIRPGSTNSNMVSEIDLAPTFETLAGAQVASNVDGTDISRLLGGSVPAGWQKAVLVEHHGPNTSPSDPDRPAKNSGNPPTYEAVRTPTAVYVEYVTGDREYYDLTKDPNELTNLAGSAPTATLASMRALLQGLERCHGRGACQAAAGAK